MPTATHGGRNPSRRRPAAQRRGRAAAARAGRSTGESIALLTRLAWGYRISQALYVAARLRIAEQLTRGPLDAVAIARRCGADPVALRRLLSALAAVGVFKRHSDGRFAQSRLSQCLIEGHRPSIRRAMIMWMEDHYTAWTELLHSTRTGRAAFPRVHGVGFYRFLAKDRRAAVRFDAALGELTSREARALVPDYDFGSSHTILDVGGGRGELLAAILKVAPSASGILFDRPAVIRAARARWRRLRGDSRMRFVSGDFFRSVPQGADLLILRWILHNWNDPSALRILRNCRRAMPRTGRLLLIEELMPDRTSHDWAYLSAALGDLNMLVLLGGHERTRAEYRQLLDRAGFRPTRVIPGTGYAILEARLASRRGPGRP